MNRLLSLVIVTLALCLSGCGYYNPYVAKGYRQISLHHSMWPNRTTEIGLENVLFQAQADWFRKSPLISFAESAAGADYVLSGNIDQVTYPEVSFGAYEQGIQGNANLTVSFALREQKTGKVVWKQSSTRTEAFTMVQNPNLLQTNRKVALQKIADAYAEEIYLYLINTIMRPGTEPIQPIKSYTNEPFNLEKRP